MFQLRMQQAPLAALRRPGSTSRPVSHITLGVKNCLRRWLPGNVLSCKFAPLQMRRRRMQPRRRDRKGWSCESNHDSYGSIHSRLKLFGSTIVSWFCGHT